MYGAGVIRDWMILMHRARLPWKLNDYCVSRVGGSAEREMSGNGGRNWSASRTAASTSIEKSHTQCNR